MTELKFDAGKPRPDFIPRDMRLLMVKAFVTHHGRYTHYSRYQHINMIFNATENMYLGSATLGDYLQLLNIVGILLCEHYDKPVCKRDIELPGTVANFSAVPMRCWWSLSVILGHGATKYKVHGWADEKLDSGRMIAAMERHIIQSSLGLHIDQDSGHYHIEHAFACICIAATKIARQAKK